MGTAVPPSKAAEVVVVPLHRFRESNGVAHAVENIGLADDLRVGAPRGNLNERSAFVLVGLTIEHDTERGCAGKGGVAVVGNVIVPGDAAAEIRRFDDGIAGADISL